MAGDTKPSRPRGDRARRLLFTPIAPLLPGKNNAPGTLARGIGKVPRVKAMAPGRSRSALEGGGAAGGSAASPARSSEEAYARGDLAEARIAMKPAMMTHRPLPPATTTSTRH